jgi:long-chain acyl-CoA synthetase
MGLTYEEVLKQLTGPGAPFEVVTETVAGRPQRNFKNRERSLREKIANASLRGDAACLVHGDQRISYREFARLCWGAARALRDGHGFRHGDRLAVLSYNCPEWILALFGATSLGGIGVGLNGWWSPEELDYGLRDSGSRVLVVDERLWPRVESVARNAPDLETIFYIGASPPAGTRPIAELLEPCDAVPTEPIAEDDPFVILYTSGTTGRSKGCITTHRGTIAQVLGIIFSRIAAAMLDGPDSPAAKSTAGQAVSLLSSPLFHVGGLHSNVCALLTAGARMVFLDGKFDPEKVMQLIERERVQSWGAIPTMLHRVVHHPKVRDYDLSSLAAVSFGGAPTAPETIEKAREVLPIEPSFANAYGLTETHGVATVNAGRALLERKSSAGRPIPVLELKLIDESGGELPPGRLGEICFRGATITPGYWNRPDATAETVRDGWLHTGDLGYVDDAGFLFVADRAKDMIIRGGENVYCVEIENCLADHPEIDEAAIVGVPDPELGERVKAIVRRMPGSRLDARGVQAHVAAHLASFKVPEIVEFTEEPLPRNPAGKLLKNVLRGQTSGFAGEPA